jgi:hypothetical protein
MNEPHFNVLSDIETDQVGGANWLADLYLIYCEIMDDMDGVCRRH